MRPVLLAAVVLAAVARASPEASHRGRVVVDFAAETSDEAWFASALQQRLLQELARFSRVALVDPLSPSPCPSRGPRCLVSAYSDRAEIVVLGTLGGDRLRYELFETWTGSMAAAGTLDVGRSTSGAGLQHQMGAIVRPIVKSGGLVDQLSAREPSQASGGGAAREAAPPMAALWVGLAVIAAGLLPLLAGLRLVGAEALAPQRSAPLLALTLSGVAVAFFVVSPQARQAAQALRPALDHPAAGLVFNVLGGVLWATFALLHLAFALPPLHGIGRIRPDALWPVFRAWAATSALRSWVLLAYLPVGLAVLAAGGWFGLSDRALWMLVLPSVGLLACFWVLVLVNVLSAYLDRRLVDGLATANNPWHHTLRRYLRGYVRRTGADVSPSLLSRILFLSGTGEGVQSYGGVLSAPRIVIDSRLLELALGLPEDPESPERKVDLDALPLGFVVPDADGAVGAPRRAAAQARAREASAGVRGKGHAARRLGEAATLLGWVIPATRDETVPLIANTEEDYEVVHSLLTEHYAAFEKDGYDDDDDTDPRQKDFLFGALLRELGALRRRDTLLSTLRLSYLELSSGSRLLRRVNGALGELFDRLFSRAPAFVADAYVALNHGRDPLIQYYAYLRSRREEPLTARADAPLLYRTSRDLLEALEREPPSAEDRQLFRATLRNRLVSLSRFFYAPVMEQHTRVFRRAAAALAMVGLAGLLSVWVSRSVDYHPVYVERMSNAGGVDGGTR